MTGYQAALAYVRRGWAVVPLDGKRPIPQGWQSGRLRTVADVEEWWGDTPSRNVGLVTGRAGCGLWVLDVDARSGGFESLAQLEAEHGALPRTLRARTGGGGLHLFWRMPEGVDVPCATGLRPGIDVKANGGQVVVWPSVHPDTSKMYQWDGRVEDMAEAPPWLLDLVLVRERQKAAQRKMYEALPVRAVDDSRMARWAARALDGACSDVAQAGEGTRHDVLLRKARMVGGYVAAGALAEGEAAARLTDAGLAAGLGGREVSTVVRDGLAHGMREPMPVPLRLLEEVTAPAQDDAYLDALAEAEEPLTPLAVVPPAREHRPTDVGNAERLVERFGADVRWCGAMPGDGLLVWDGRRWAADTRRKVDGLARAVAAELHDEAMRLGERADEAARQAGDKPTPAQKDQLDAVRSEARTWLAWARQSEMAPRLEAMVRVARSEVAVSHAELDADAWRLNTWGGIVDLRTGQVERHSREQLCTRVAGAAVGGECPTWLAFLRRIMGGDEAMVEYLQRIVGYCLTGSTREQCMFILYGNGSNGKSTFLDTLRTVLGDYAVHARAETFMRERRGGGIPNDVAALRGARLVTSSEPEQGEALDESLVKEMTGDAALTARFMRSEFFTFEPTFKVLLATNHRPVIRGTDNGIWRRLRLVPFTQLIEDHEKDRELGRKLEAERDGILAWALAGCMEWQRRGTLDAPASVVDATGDYRADMDILSEFMAEKCVTGPSFMVGNTELYEAFATWAARNGERARSHRWLSRALIDRGFVQDPDRSRGRRWRGLGLKGVQPVPPPRRVWAEGEA